MGMSIRAYARRRDVSHVAVLEASVAGRIPLEVNGTIDPAEADAAWERSEAMKRVVAAAVCSVHKPLKEKRLPVSGSVALAHEIAKAAGTPSAAENGGIARPLTRDRHGVALAGESATCGCSGRLVPLGLDQPTNACGGPPFIGINRAFLPSSHLPLRRCLVKHWRNVPIRNIRLAWASATAGANRNDL